jgi:hypothetical protein
MIRIYYRWLGVTPFIELLAESQRWTPSRLLKNPTLSAEFS